MFNSVSKQRDETNSLSDDIDTRASSFFLITVVGLILVLGSKFITHVSVDALRTVCSTSKGRIVHSLDHFVAENAVVFRDGALTHHL